ncbi:hypothetical protein GAYE_PCTG14G0540 [Galdieria yellowstonensis]|uniref:Uncharacterized protein n=1 Tax=Galdieria yellowstonensis TaxID=3028027 RepID=A0AAV9I7W0_9RHOD|nr:hypothetical protein GAYE_PCTG14G0540 [Galdieria yellowstonensis]
MTSKRDAPRHKKNKWLYDNKVTQENNQQLRKACKVAIKFLRLKTIKKLQRTKETSHERQALIDKLQVLRTLKVDSILSAIQDRSLVASDKSIYVDILKDKRVLEAIRKVSNKQQQQQQVTKRVERNCKLSENVSLKTNNRKSSVETTIKSVFLDSLNGEVVARNNRNYSTIRSSKDSAFLESSDLHPSWRAKRWRRKWESSIRFQGSHIYL